MTHTLNHPLIRSMIAQLRDQKTDALRFRHLVKEITKILLYESLKEEKTCSKEMTTWQGTHTEEVIKEDDYVVVTVLRAGLPMLEAVTESMPSVVSGFLAMRRDESSHKSRLFYDRLPDCEGKTVILVDVMLATGGSFVDAIQILKMHGIEKIIVLNVIASPEGKEVLENAHPDIALYIAQLDDHLNDDKFIIPGLGDAGDREYNTPE